MLIAVAVLAIGTFAAIVAHRLKVDIEREKDFRAQLNGGVRIDDRAPILS
ncbi:MAG TPA: hypothetical protein VF773_12055 [Verrucomicrobiae bacterium]